MTTRFLVLQSNVNCSPVVNNCLPCCACAVLILEMVWKHVRSYPGPPKMVEKPLRHISRPWNDSFCRFEAKGRSWHCLQSLSSSWDISDKRNRTWKMSPVVTNSLRAVHSYRVNQYLLKTVPNNYQSKCKMNCGAARWRRRWVAFFLLFACPSFFLEEQ